MESVDYLHKPENSKLFKRVRQMVQLLLMLTIAAMAVLAFNFI